MAAIPESLGTYTEIEVPSYTPHMQPNVDSRRKYRVKEAREDSFSELKS